MEEDPKKTNPEMAPIAPRIIFGTFGFAFAGIGVSLLVFLWMAPFDAFGSPPLFFRVFGSLIAICFVAVGTTLFIGAIFGSTFPTPNAALQSLIERNARRNGMKQNPPVLNYSCPNCGAQLGKDVQVSPLGDVNCQFCHQWFNVHASPGR